MKLLPAIFAALGAALLCSCGSLDRSIPSRQLSKDDIAFINAVPEGNGDAMLQGYGRSRISGSQSSSVFYPAFPWLQGECFFKDSKGSGYGLLTIYALMPVIPLFIGSDGTIYDEQGLMLSAHHTNSIPLLYSYAELTSDYYDDVPNFRDKNWQFDFLALPYIDGFIGFGDGYFQLFWTPIVKQDPYRCPRKCIDFSYSPAASVQQSEHGGSAQ